MKTALATFAAIFALTVGASAAMSAMTVNPAPAAQSVTNACDTDSECAALPQCALKPGCDGGPDSAPFRLVGYGCDGATAPLFRDEESDFPRCDRIEVL